MPTQLDRARHLREAASDDPDAVNPAHVIELLRHPQASVQREAAQAFLPLVTEYPYAGTPAVERIAYLLRSLEIDEESDLPDETVQFGEALLLSLARIAGEAPEKAGTARREVFEYLADPNGPLAAPASVCLAQFAEEETAALSTHLDVFEALLNAESAATRRNAAHILTQIAANHPRAVSRARSSLSEHLADSDPQTAKKSAVALGLVARNNSDQMSDAIPALVEALDAKESGLRANAAGALADIAVGLPEAVGDHSEALLAHLDDDAAAVRRNTAAVLARLGSAGTELSGAADRGLIGLLDDPDSTVRATACQALGFIESSVADELLRATAADDDSPAVREAAKRALDRV